jgi:hypothetical protein
MPVDFRKESIGILFWKRRPRVVGFPSSMIADLAQQGNVVSLPKCKLRNSHQEKAFPKG